MHLIGIVAIIYVIYKLIQEKIEKNRPYDPNKTFDTDAYMDDFLKGVNVDRNRAKYYKDKSEIQPKWWNLPLDTVVDVERYEYDRKHYGEFTANYRKSGGEYRRIKPIEKLPNTKRQKRR